MTYGEKFFRKSIDYKPLFKLLAKEYGAEKAKYIRQSAGNELDGIISRFPDMSEGERQHTDKFIFPRIALYRVLQAEAGDKALKYIEDTVTIQGKRMGKLLKGISSLPAMEWVFLKIFSSMAESMFGESGGFRQTFYDSPKGIVKFDITDCIYCRYCRLCGCPELIHSFCITDNYCFGSLSKIKFTRTETLETGNKCDFTLSIEK